MFDAGKCKETHTVKGWVGARVQERGTKRNTCEWSWGGWAEAHRKTLEAAETKVH